MAKIKFKSVDDYIAAQPLPNQPVLLRVRAILQKALPGADEVISYQIPAFKQNGRVVIFFAGWKEHFSLYPSSDRLVEAFKQELEGYTISKGTIRFPLAERIPVKLITGIARFRAKEMAERRKA